VKRKLPYGADRHIGGSNMGKKDGNTTTKRKPAPTKRVKTKPKRKPVKKTVAPTKNKIPSQILDKNDILPDVKIDFCNTIIKGRLHTFLLYYLTPGQNCFHNAKQAAIKAGYAESTAGVDVYAILKRPEIRKIISANENLAAYSLQEAAKRAIEIKKNRAFYDPSDFFEKKVVELKTKEGQEYEKTITGLKDLKDMTLEQRLCIDGMDIKGQASIPMYIMPDRKKELDDIIKLDRELSGGVAGGQDVEELKEVIMERVTIRQMKRAATDAALISKILERAEGRGEEEL